MEKKNGSPVSYGFYKPHRLSFIALVISIIAPIILFLPSNFKAMVGQYPRLFHLEWVFILIIAIITIVLFYLISRPGVEEKITGIKATEEKKEGE